MQNQLQNVAYSLIIITISGWLLYIGSSLILPMVFALLFAMFLLPIDKWMSTKIKINWLSIIASFLVVIIPIFLVIYLFSVQTLNIIDSLPSIGNEIEKGFNKLLSIVNEAFPALNLNADQLLSENTNKLLDGPLNVLSKGLISSTELIVNSGITLIYTFFILLYRKSFKNFVIFQFEKNNHRDIKSTLSEIKNMVQSYVGGLGIVILILAFFNSLGLLIIGVDYAIFWGALSGILAIIPYVGTGVGAMLPLLYSLASSDSNWQPIAILIYFIVIQQIEGNIITPKIVGDKVNINPMFAIISLIFFGSFWGIGGVILALPIISIIRIVLDQFNETKPLAVLMGSEIAQDYSKFKKIADNT